ncbi:MAG: sugar-transfer associated ATP-grasp domain-containing protein [Microcella sp.]|uniref:sugar-transfer associated ATP-grasp domain-containing protein n=1 Tax=Microcella sp. TaxID=1913979 RepID=UPI003315F51A
MRSSKLASLSAQIASATGRARPLIALDMLWCSVRHEAAFQDYFDWDFFALSARERRTFMTHPKSNHLAQKLNAVAHRQQFSDKCRFNARFSEYIGRDWLDLRAASDEELEAFLRAHERVMAKVPDSLGGDGVESFVAASALTDVASFRSDRLARRQFLLEEFLAQDPEMARLCPTSVNTLRIVTFRDGDEVRTLVRVLKMGNGGDVDNFSGGGMYTILDADGLARYPAFDEFGGVFSAHPLTSTSIVGFSVPQWDAVERLTDALAREVPEIPYVGWDIAITPEGPVVVEGNYNTGVFQLKPTATGIRTGLLPVYREAIGF